MDELDLGATLRGFIAGQKLFGRYTLIRQLGRGGMGVVWRARDESLERDVAIKMLPEMVSNDPASVRELKRETSRNQQLSHPHILRVYDFAEGAGLCGITMEIAEGGTLTSRRLDQPGEVFAPAQLADWVRQLCEALDYAHQRAKVVHRDLKPANLMLTADGELKVTDFGIAASLSESVTRVSKQAGSSGTPVYMSPQQMMGDKPAVTDDLYALGATLYELLTGKPPFYSGNVLLQVQSKTAPSLAERRAELGVTGEPIPPEWEQTVAACLAKEPKDRPQSAGEVGERLGLAIRGSKGAKAKEGGQTAAGGARSTDASDPEKVERATFVASRAATVQSAPSKHGRFKVSPHAGAIVVAILVLLGGAWWLIDRYLMEPVRQEEALVAGESQYREIITLIWRIPYEATKEEMAAKRTKVDQFLKSAPEKYHDDVRKKWESIQAEWDKIQKAKAEMEAFRGASRRGSRFITRILGGLQDLGPLISLKLDRQQAVIMFRAQGNSVETLPARLSAVAAELRDDPLIGAGNKVELTRLERSPAGHHEATIEVVFAPIGKAGDMPVGRGELATGNAKVKLDLELLALVDSEIARATGRGGSELIVTNQIARNLQRFYEIESETGVKLLDIRQLTAEGVAVPFRMSLEGTLTQVLKFMSRLEALFRHIQYNEYSLSMDKTLAAAELERQKMAHPWAATLMTLQAGGSLWDIPSIT